MNEEEAREVDSQVKELAMHNFSKLEAVTNPRVMKLEMEMKIDVNIRG